MPERTALTQILQLAPEVTPGTLLAATKEMQALMLTSGPKFTFDGFRASGYKYKSVIVPGKEWWEGKIVGYPTYTELVYPFSGVFGAAVITTPSGGSTSRLWTFSPSINTPDTPQTYTFEIGSSVRAFKLGYGLFKGFSFTFNRDKVSMGGDVVGQKISDGISLTGGTATIALQPIVANQLYLYSDSTSAGLGTTKLARVMSGEFAISNKWGELWTVDGANASFATHVEIEPKATFKFLVEADVAGMGFLANARAGSTIYNRLTALGSNIEACVPTAPTAAAGAAGVPNGVYKYQITFVTAQGETAGGAEATVTLTSQKGSLTNIPLGPLFTTSRKVYRTAAGGATGTEKFVATIADNTTTVYLDNMADGSLGANIPTVDTSGLLGYTFNLDMALKLNSVSEFKDEQGVYAIEYQAECVSDTGWGHAFQAYLQNTLSAL